ncbi:MAG TPA: transposase [Candidatus Paceibacterota bacterium]|nr:transposase [Candidatus Paceibacterota bacterium]
MERGVTFSVGEFYHIYNRGVDKRAIFLSRDDYRRFIRLLFCANSEKAFVYRDIKDIPFSKIVRTKPLVAIGAWVLMPNHFHLLVREVEESGISRFMEKLLTAYSAYFNKRYGRVGSLFQGRFAAQHSDTEEYLKYLFAYIHLNPVKLIEPDWKEVGIKDFAQTKRFITDYAYSSFSDYLHDEREESGILTKKEFPEYFLNNKDFTDFIFDWLKDKNT